MDTRDLPIAGCTVRSVRRHGYQVLLELSDQYQLVVENAFTVTVPWSRERIDPQDPSADLAPHHLALAGRAVAAAASRAGRLRVECSGGAVLEVRAQDTAEAWQLLGPDGYLVVCLPGGELAVWSATVGAASNPLDRPL